MNAYTMVSVFQTFGPTPVWNSLLPTLRDPSLSLTDFYPLLKTTQVNSAWPSLRGWAQ